MNAPKEPPGLVSRLLFFWMLPLFYKGIKHDLSEDDLVPAKHIYGSTSVADKLERCWSEEVSKARLMNFEPSFTKVLIKAFAWSYLPGGIMQFINSTLRIVSPLLFGQMLRYWSLDAQGNPAITREWACYYAVAMIVTIWLAAYVNHQSNLYCSQFGMKLRVATGALIFRKIMIMDNASLGDITAGKIVNLMSNDLQRFDLGFLFMHYVWIIPLQLIAVVYLGYVQAGVSAIIGFVALVVIALPVQVLIGKYLGRARVNIADRTDERIKVMSEVINGIQVIKMYAWEIPFQNTVREKRKHELKMVRIATLLRVVFIGFLVFSERTALFITVVAYLIFGNIFSANTIYPLQQLMGALQINITLILPLALSFTSELLVSLRRVQNIMVLKNRDDVSWRGAVTRIRKSQVHSISYKQFEAYTNNGYASDNQGSLVPGDNVAVSLYGVSASWIGDQNALALKNISVKIRKGKLCAVIGPVGAGKSSFLQLLLRELRAETGTVSINGKISYACQESWLFPSTVRENILFGLPMDEEKYRRICKVCCLEKDFKQFPYGDQTLAGERGVSLSGGQRARINLARAVYREADIYLLDDPLSAVDANVGRQLFERCIEDELRGRTRVLVTHQVHFLKSADFIVVLKEGNIENMGTFDELVNSGKDFPMMLLSLQETNEKDEDDIISVISPTKNLIRARSRSQSTTSENEEYTEYEVQQLTPEEMQSGHLRWEVVAAYLTSGGSRCFIFFTLFMLLASVSSAAAVDYWVGFWSNQMSTHQNEIGNSSTLHLDDRVGPFTMSQYLTVYGCIVASCIVITFLRVLPFTHLCVTASNRLHDLMFSTMLRGVMNFFFTSSSGRILNRFTKDMGAVDEFVPRTLLDVLQIFTTLAAILVLNAIALYWTIIPSILLMLLFCFFLAIYLKTAQCFKRLEAVSKSPMFGMVTSSLSGMATIRACGAEPRLAAQFDAYQDLNTSAWNCYIASGVAFGLYTDTLCLVYLGTIIFVFLFIDFGGLIPVGSVGLALTQSMMLTAMLQHGARMLVDFVGHLTSVERVLEYTRIPSEPHLLQGKITALPSWPEKGHIVFQNLSLRYASNKEPVLKNLNFTIESGWKVGIVGRTGAGKSSLIAAIFRFAENEGSILIDDVDISLVGRQELRSKISIIPQEPVLFSATIRYNLDPFNKYTDDDLWRALDQVDMKSAVNSLQYKVTEGGANFSIGQRQLLCLARAVLRSNKILIMDEATANVDPQTDKLIQQTIRRQFSSCTVLTIAHRLNTVMDSDRILVMDGGQVAEYDHPYELLLDTSSNLSKMVSETGDKNSEQLFQIAKAAYSKSKMKL